MEVIVDMQTRVAAALMQWRLIERALHDAEGWSMTLGGVERPVVVEVGADQVRFTAEFLGVCLLSGADLVAFLSHRGDLVRAVPVEDAEIGDVVEWTLALDPVLA